MYFKFLQKLAIRLEVCLAVLLSPAHHSHQTLCSGTAPLEAGWSKNNQHCPQHTLTVQTGERGNERGREEARERRREGVSERGSE